LRSSMRALHSPGKGSQQYKLAQPHVRSVRVLARLQHWPGLSARNMTFRQKAAQAASSNSAQGKGPCQAAEAQPSVLMSKAYKGS
jgi:hypothetical protein